MKVRIRLIVDVIESGFDLELDINDDKFTIEQLCLLLLDNIDALKQTEPIKNPVLRVTRGNVQISLLPQTLFRESGITNGDILQIHDKNEDLFEKYNDTSNPLNKVNTIIPKTVRKKKIKQIYLKKPKPEEIKNENPFPLVALIIPLILGLAMFIFNPSPLSIIFIAMTPLMMIGNWASNVFNSNKKTQSNQKKYQELLNKHEHDKNDALENEKALLVENFPDFDNAQIYEKHPDQECFLKIPLGVSDVKSNVKVDESFLTLKNSIITIDINQNIAIKPFFEKESPESFYYYFLAYINKVYSPQNLKIALFADAHNTELRSTDQLLNWSGLIDRNLSSASSESSKKALDAINALLEDNYENHLLIIAETITPEVIAQLEKVAKKYKNVSVVYLINDETKTPHNCQVFFDEETSQLLDLETHQTFSVSEIRKFSLQKCWVELLKIANCLNGVIEFEESLSLPKQVYYSDILADNQVKTDKVRWMNKTNKSSKRSLKIPVGLAITNKKEPSVFTLDLLKQGPHALVGGTTGAGKSEFLQTWICSLAFHYSPEELNFLLIDYKGGAAFAKCIELPHTVALVTDLSESLLERVLLSLKAELVYRESFLNKIGATSIDDLYKNHPKHKAGLASLVIIVDEFAAIATDIPTFTDKMVDIAQRGRSLGVHLVMATQRPSGVITNNLKANTNLRIALRVTDEMDSHDIIGNEKASQISNTPGRGYAKIGNEPPIMFQTAYLGAPFEKPSTLLKIELSTLSKKTLLYQKETDQISVSALEKMCATVKNQAEQQKIKQPRPICLTPLPTNAEITTLKELKKGNFALMDIPAKQKQEELQIPKNNILITGGPNSGKTNCIITLATILRVNNPELNIFVINSSKHKYEKDFLNTVASVLDYEDTETITRLFGIIKKNFLHKNKQQICLLIDSLDLFYEKYDQLQTYAINKELQEVLANSGAYNLQIIATNSRPGALNNSFSAYFQEQIILRLSSENDYGYLNISPSLLKGENIPSRGIYKENLIQIYHLNFNKLKLKTLNQKLEIQSFQNEYPYNGEFWAVKYEDLTKKVNFSHPSSLIIYKNKDSIEKIVQTLEKEIIKAVKQKPEIISVDSDETIASWNCAVNNKTPVIALVDFNNYQTNWNISSSLKNSSAILAVNIEESQMFSIYSGDIPAISHDLRKDSTGVCHYIHDQKIEVICIAT